MFSQVRTLLSACFECFHYAKRAVCVSELSVILCAPVCDYTSLHALWKGVTFTLPSFNIPVSYIPDVSEFSRWTCLLFTEHHFLRF